MKCMLMLVLFLSVGSFGEMSQSKTLVNNLNEDVVTGVGVENTPTFQVVSGKGALGAGCVRDNQCRSGECKGLRCVKRDYAKHPLLRNGQNCLFDGDCKSGQCAWYKKCVAK